MTTAIIFHEVHDGTVWARAWEKGPGSRHEMFGRLGIKCRNFRDPSNPDSTGVMAEIPDMALFQQLLQSEEGQKAMREDGLKVDTMRMLIEFTPQRVKRRRDSTGTWGRTGLQRPGVSAGARAESGSVAG